LQNIDDELKKVFKQYTDDFKELVKLEDFDALIHYCLFYIKEKGKRMYLYDSNDPKHGKVTGVISYEKINQTHIRRVLESMAYQYYDIHGLPNDREVIFDTDSFDDWEFMKNDTFLKSHEKSMAKNMKGGESNEGI